MTQPDAADAIMEIMQSYVDKERKKIWELVTNSFVPTIPTS